MSVLEIILIGLTLAIDASALTIANCTTYKDTLDKKKEFSMPVAFAVFQFAMPVIGYYVGSLFSSYLTTVSKFVTAGIFFLLAVKIIFDNVKELLQERKCVKEEACNCTAKFTFWVLILQAIATSIDALAIGVVFAVELKYSIFLASALIGGVTFAVALVALFFGKYLGKVFGKYAQWLGAIILIALTVKNLIEAF